MENNLTSTGINSATLEYRQLYSEEICMELFKDFIRHQNVTKCLRHENGAKKLYISAYSAVESQSFYKAMGCMEAQVYNMEHVEKEPYDCQLECKL